MMGSLCVLFLFSLPVTCSIVTDGLLEAVLSEMAIINPLIRVGSIRSRVLESPLPRNK